MADVWVRQETMKQGTAVVARDAGKRCVVRALGTATLVAVEGRRTVEVIEVVREAVRSDKVAEVVVFGVH